VRSGVTGELKATFRQSTFLSAPLSLETFKRATPGYVPTLKQNGRMVLLALTLITNERPLGDIANQLRDTYPTYFATRENAFAYIASLVGKFA
jgi:hypothetical protein